jgi:quercetin dioxygenase-like cupin family protein
MSGVGKVASANVTLAIIGLLVAPLAAVAADVPDALSVEWQGKKLCEKLAEDAQVRVVRCIFPPGAVHVCHSHPSYVGYFVTGGQAQVQDDKGIRNADFANGAVIDVTAVPWHEFANVGGTTMEVLAVEKKYTAPPLVSRAACPTRSQ